MIKQICEKLKKNFIICFCHEIMSDFGENKVQNCANLSHSCKIIIFAVLLLIATKAQRLKESLTVSKILSVFVFLWLSVKIQIYGTKYTHQSRFECRH